MPQPYEIAQYRWRLKSSVKDLPIWFDGDACKEYGIDAIAPDELILRLHNGQLVTVKRK